MQNNDAFLDIYLRHSCTDPKDGDGDRGAQTPTPGKPQVAALGHLRNTGNDPHPTPHRVKSYKQPATDTSLNSESVHEALLDIILCNEGTTKLISRLRWCAV